MLWEGSPDSGGKHTGEGGSGFRGISEEALVLVFCKWGWLLNSCAQVSFLNLKHSWGPVGLTQGCHSRYSPKLVITLI